MDMFEFREMMAREYDVSEMDTTIFDRVAVIKFDYDERGMISGRCRLGIVFRDKDSESRILPGETWVCSLTQNTPRQYFGKALMKVDAAMLYGLTMDQLEGITDALWENQRDDMLALMEEKYRPEVEKEIEARLEESSGHYEARIKELESVIESLEKKNDEYLLKMGEAEDSVNELKVRLRNAENSVSYSPAVQSKNNQPSEFKALRVSGDKLYSSEFKDGTYKTFFSVDRTKVQFVPSERGKTVCKDGLMTVMGLERYIPFVDSVTWDAVADAKGRIEFCPAE